VQKWDDKLRQVAARGYIGMRANGNANWLRSRNWRRFVQYESTLNASLAGRPMIVLCSYPLRMCRGVGILDVARVHLFAIAKRARRWEVVEWRTPPPAPDRYESLTGREREVLSTWPPRVCRTRRPRSGSRWGSAPWRATGPT
jgi:hypothetical protein